MAVINKGPWIMESPHSESIKKVSDLNRFFKMEAMFMWLSRRERAAHKERCRGMTDHSMFNKLQIIQQERCTMDVRGGNRRKKGYLTREGWRGPQRPDQGEYGLAVLSTSLLEYI